MSVAAPRLMKNALPSSGTAGRLIPVGVTKAPALSVEGPRSVPSRISVVLVDGTMAGDTPGRECPREDGFWRPQAGETRPAAVSVGGGDDGLPRVGETFSSPDVAGRSLPVVPAGGSSSVVTANPAGSDGPVVAGGPIGQCETLSPLFHDALGPLEHSGSRSVRAFGSGPCWPRWPACCWGPCWPGRDVIGSGSIRAFRSGPC